MTWVVHQHLPRQMLGPATRLPAPRDGSGHAQTWRTANGSVFVRVGNLAGGGRETQNSPSNTKENRLATVGMNMKQNHTETWWRLVFNPSNPEKGTWMVAPHQGDILPGFTDLVAMVSFAVELGKQVVPPRTQECA